MRFVAAVIVALVLVACGHGAGTRIGTPAEERCDFDDMVGGQVEPGAKAPVVLPNKKAWEATFGGEEAARPHVRARLAGWPQRLVVPRPPHDEADRDFMTRVARDTWRGLSALVDRAHRLPVDNVRLGADPRVGDYTNITTVGLRMVAIVAARELALVSDAEALAELRALFTTLDRLETHAGFFFNYYDTTSLERSSNLVSFVDSSSRALVDLSRSVPIVVAAGGELVGPGLVASLASPGGSVTGLQVLAPELAAKRLQLIKELVPRLTRLAVLRQRPSDGGEAAAYHQRIFSELETSARTLSVQIRLPSDERVRPRRCLQ
jgi:hypothetical protein